MAIVIKNRMCDLSAIKTGETFIQDNRYFLVTEKVEGKTRIVELCTGYVYTPLEDGKGWDNLEKCNLLVEKV